jgi:CRISPR-associated exonuclease Cas4
MLDLMWDKIVYTGVQVQYYFIDKKKLWYFSHYITFEKESELVKLGQLISRYFYKREKKELQIGRIKVDFYRRKMEIHEVKKSSKFKEASRWQLIYYLYVLKKLNVNCIGILHFPLERKTEKIVLNPELELKMEEILNDIKRIITLDKPPETEESFRLKKSAYYEFFMA